MRFDLKTFCTVALLTFLSLAAVRCQNPKTAGEQILSGPQPSAGARASSTMPGGDNADPGTDRVIAIVGGRSIRLHQLEKPLVEAYGLNVLLNLVQLELAKQQAAKSGVSVTDADVARERELTMQKMFADAAKEDYETLLEQFLAQQRISRPEFELVVETNAHLRKIAEPILAGKLTEQNLKEGFDAIYGETIEVRDIQVANLQEVAEARRRIAAGEPFEKVAREMSTDARTAPLGGALPPFSRQMDGVSDTFKEAAFALRPGEISEAIQTGEGYHLIKMIRRNAPKAVKYEDMKEAVRHQLEDRWVTQVMKDLRNAIAQEGMKTLEIEDPVLKKQFDKRMGVNQQAAADRQRIERERENERVKIRQQQEFREPPSTQATVTIPATRRSAEPPATKPGR